MTLKKLTRPSDDPTAVANALVIRSQQKAADQYARNLDNGDGWLTTLDSAMTGATNAMHRVRDLTIQASSDALSPTAKEAIAVELESLRDNLLSQANKTYLGRSVFAGTSDAPGAFVYNPVLTFTGTAGSAVERRIGPDTTLRVDADGSAIFGTGANSIFSLVDTIAADLRGGANVNVHLAGLADRMETILGHHAEIGTRHAQVQRAQAANMELIGSLEARRESVEDADLARTVMDLRMQEVNYKAALDVTARVLQPTLMDFLR